MPAFTFDDEFTGPAGSAPDPAKWTHELGAGGWGNNELETYVDDRQHSFLDGQGHLVIRATKTVTAGQASYESARIKTEGRFSQAQGRFGTRIKINSRRGLWPAFWLLGESIGDVGWPRCGEIDMVEGYGWDPSVETSVHTPVAVGQVQDPDQDQDPDINTRSHQLASDSQWHTYGMHWTTTSAEFYYDGVRYLTVASGDIPNWCFGADNPMFMIANLAVGGTGPGPVPDDTVFPVDMLIDYVRVSA